MRERDVREAGGNVLLTLEKVREWKDTMYAYCRLA